MIGITNFGIIGVELQGDMLITKNIEKITYEIDELPYNMGYSFLIEDVNLFKKYIKTTESPQCFKDVDLMIKEITNGYTLRKVKLWLEFLIINLDKSQYIISTQTY